MPTARGVPLLLCLSLALQAVGCRSEKEKTPPREPIGVIDVSLPPASAEALKLEAADVATLAMAALAATERFEKVPPDLAVKGDDASTWTLRAEVVFARVAPARSPGGAPIAEAAIRLRLSRDSGDRLAADGSGQQELSFQAGAANDLRLALEEALQEAASLLDAELRAMSRSDEELIPDLQASEPERRDIAIRILAERRSVEAIPGLIALLEDTDRERQLRAVGALVAIGDPEAAPALIDATVHRDPAFVIQIAYALSELGGDDAEAYLFTIANGHPDPAVRQAGREALRSLEKRREAARKLEGEAAPEAETPTKSRP